MSGGRKPPKRSLSPEEEALWRSVARTASPLPKHKLAERPTNAPPASDIGAAPKRLTPLAPKLDDIAKSSPPVGPPSMSRSPAKTSISRRPAYIQSLKSAAGLDRNTARRLKQGRLEPQGRVDLHGMTAERAHRALTRFILSAYSSGKRCVLIITGKGGRHRRNEDHHIRDFEEVGVLKSITPEWLAMPPISNVIVGVYPAHVKHGGAGALYVYLRKNELLRGVRD